MGRTSRMRQRINYCWLRLLLLLAVLLVDTDACPSKIKEVGKSITGDIGMKLKSLRKGKAAADGAGSSASNVVMKGRRASITVEAPLDMRRGSVVTVMVDLPKRGMSTGKKVAVGGATVLGVAGVGAATGVLLNANSKHPAGRESQLTGPSDAKPGAPVKPETTSRSESSTPDIPDESHPDES